MKTFHIIEHGRQYNAAFQVDGREVCVSSAYGSERAPIGRQDPEEVAQAVLGEIVRTWRPTTVKPFPRRR
jgi:hypothetical protein